MSKKVAISDGHEIHTPGKRTPPIAELGGRQIKENEFNKAVAILLEKELERCGIDVINVSDTNNDSLADRVNRANRAKADIFVAIHYNAYDSSFGGHDPSGIETFYYPSSSGGRRLAKSIHKHLIKGTKQKDRGVKSGDFYVLRNTHMPAILSENGFMDNKREALLMIDKDFQKEVAVEHTKGICDYFGIKYVAENISKPIESEDDNMLGWQKELGEKAVKDLAAKDLLNNPESWLDKLDENVPNWLFFEMMNRISGK